MTTQDFFELLYGDCREGHLLLYELPGKRSHAFPVADTAAAAAKALELSEAGQHSFYTVCIQAEAPTGSGRAKESKAIAVPGFWLDIDFGTEGHSGKHRLPPDLEAAVAWVRDLFALPPTLMVNSGGGLHAYWLLREPLTFPAGEVAQAKTLNRRIRKALMELRPGWYLDPCFDLARLLRPVGTRNPKHGKTVEVLEYNPDARYVIEDFNCLPLIEATREHAPRQEWEGEPGEASSVIDRCGFLRHCVEDQADLAEPEWWGMISVLSRCRDGSTAVHAASRGYAGYSEAETNAKITYSLSNGGPLTCAYIRDNLDGQYCRSCQYCGSVSSPICLAIPAYSEKLDALVELNSRYALVESGEGFLVNERYVTNTDKAGRKYAVREIDLLSEKGFRLRERPNALYQEDEKGKPKRIEVAGEWLKWRKRRTVLGLKMLRDEDDPRYFRLWNGFAVQPRQGDWSLYHNMVRDIICAGDLGKFEYILNWLAFLVQHGGKRRTDTAIILKSLQEGTGKTLFTLPLQMMFGDHFEYTTSKDTLFGTFNNHLLNKIVVFADDVSWAGDFQLQEQLKTLVTGNRLRINKKFITSFVADNHINLILASNNEWSVKASAYARRWLVCKVSAEHVNDVSYYGPIIHQLENGGVEAMLYDLLRRDIRDFQPRILPENADLTQEKRNSDPVLDYYLAFLEDRDVNFAQDIAKEDFHAGFLALYGQSPAASSYRSPQQFFRHLSALKVLPPNIQETKRRSENTYTGETTRKVHMRLPDLDECRNHVETILDTRINWGEGIQETATSRTAYTGTAPLLRQ